jgi:hypothetical protein
LFLEACKTTFFVSPIYKYLTILLISRKKDSHYNPRVPETFFNSPYLIDFSAFPIGNPKQQHNRPPDGPNVFDPNIVSDFSYFNQNLHHNYPPIFPKPKKRSIFESRNPFSGPTVQGPDYWNEL